MAGILPARKFVQQPQVAAPVDKGNPLTALLTSAYIPSLRFQNELLSGAANLYPNYQPVPSIGSKGVGYKVTNADVASMLYAIPAISNSFANSVFILVEFTDLTSSGDIWGAGQSGTYMTKIAKSGGFLKAVLNDNGGGSVTSTTPIELGKIYAVLVTDPYPSVNLQMYINGTLDSSLVVGGGRIGNVQTTAGTYYGGNTRGFKLYAAYSWARVLNSAEARQLFENPWQVFAFPQRKFGVSFSGGAYTLTAQAGTYTAAGQNAQLRKSKLLNTFGGAYALSGSTANILRNRKLTSSGGAYLATGSDASLYRSRQLSLTGGSYSISGASANITFTGLSANFTLTAQGGIYSLSGSAAGITYTPLSAAYMLVAQGGSYTISGGSADLKRSKKLTASGGLYTYSGSTVNITAGPAVVSTLVKYLNVLTGEILLLQPF